MPFRMFSLIVLSTVALVGIYACASKSKVSKDPQDGVLFGEINLVVEVKPVGICKTSMGFSESIDESFAAVVRPQSKLEWLWKAPEAKHDLFNITIQSMGFDRGRISYSVADGDNPSITRYKMRVSRKSTEMIEIWFLDQRVIMNPKTSPVIGLTAEETRQDCKLTHNLNVFVENFGRYSWLPAASQ